MSSAVGQDAQAPSNMEAPSHKPWLDYVQFGDVLSEAAHSFHSEASMIIAAGTEGGIIDLPGGAQGIVNGDPGESGRVVLPLEPEATRLGDLSFLISVDPVQQNYLTVRFWGDDSSPYKTLLLVNGEQAAYRSVGDYEPINVGTRGGLPGRFFHSTAALPLASTTGQRVVEVTLRTYVLSYRTLAGQTGFEKATTISRRFFSAGTHSDAVLHPSALEALPGKAHEAALTPPSAALSPEQEKIKIQGFRQWQLDYFHALEDLADAGEPLAISRYEDDLRFYAETLLIDWSPATTAGHKLAGLRRIFSTIDHYTREYYGNVLLLGTGGHQSDWGGYYAALGEALYIVENLIVDREVLGPREFTSFLDEPFFTGTRDGTTSIAEADWDGSPLTRRAAWERVLKANFDFARSRLSYIYNQVMYTYEGAWKSHEGLRIIGSGFYQGRARSHRIVREFLGIEPFLGEEVLTAPDGRELDVHHSLFHHDDNAEYTDDYVQVIMKGLAESKLGTDGSQARRKPYGLQYYGLTLAGLVRENGYVGVYGESTNYFPCWFFRTLGHPGDEELNDDILKVALKNLHARGFTRYQGRTAEGRRVMFMEQVIDDRNSDYPGRPAYGTDEDSAAALRYAALEEFMARNPARYAAEEWAEYREYAREATGYAQQQLLDGQFFSSFDRRWIDRKLKYDLRIQETYTFVTGGRANLLDSAGAGRVLPHADLGSFSSEERRKLGLDEGWDNSSFAWVDIDNLLVSARDGDTHLFANLLERNTGLSGASRAHLQHHGTEQLLQFQADAEMPFDYVTLRGETREEYRQKANDEVIEGRPFALTGELLPVAAVPGVGKIDRDNFVEDNPYSAYPEIVTARLGKFFIAINTTRTNYQNQRRITVGLPSGYRNATVRDLVTGKWLSLSESRFTLEPLSAVVLMVGYPTAAVEAPPGRVSAVITTPGFGEVGISWKPVAGATGYTVTRHHGTSSTDFVVDVARNSMIIDASEKEAAYTVTATHPFGGGRPSQAVSSSALPTVPGSPLTGSLIGPASGITHFSLPGSYEFKVVETAGFAGGDDANLYQRGSRDSLAAATALADGSVQISARIDEASATAGVMLRENLTDLSRYVFFGFSSDRRLVLRTRTLDSREDFGIGNPGDDAGGGRTRSPFSWDLERMSEANGHWLRLHRDAEGHRVTALHSLDGKQWRRMTEAVVPLPPIVHAGLCSTGDAKFSSVSTVATEPGMPMLTAAYSPSTVTLAWTKPRDVSVFDVYGFEDDGTGAAIALGLWETSYVLPCPVSYQRFKVVGRGPGGKAANSGELRL